MRMSLKLRLLTLIECEHNNAGLDFFLLKLNITNNNLYYVAHR